MSVRTASDKGAEFEVILVEESGAEKLLTTIDVPKTGSWMAYTNTKDVIIALPSGVRTLRFKNLEHAANVGIVLFCRKWDVQLAVLEADTQELVGLVDVDTDIRTLGPQESVTIVGSVKAELDPLVRHEIGLRIFNRARIKRRRWRGS